MSDPNFDPDAAAPNPPAREAPQHAALERAAARVAACYAQFARGLEKEPVAPKVDRAALEARFRGSLQDAGRGLDGALDDFEAWALPAAMRTPHPLYAGLVNSSPLPMAPLADLLVSMLNNNSGAFHQSPPATAAETEVCRLFAEVLGLGADARGMILPGGSYANLQGLLLARARHFPRWRTAGPSAAPAAPRVYCSAAVHFSVQRAAHLVGVGEDNVVAVPTTGRGSMDLSALAASVQADRAHGHTPFAVVATTGTTGTGALDDLDGAADVCADYGLWLHVDACYGGAIALVDELAHHCRGAARADSVAIDPHKWFFQPITAGLLFCADPEIESAAFGVDASYIPGTADDAFRRGIPTSRRGTSLAVWLTLRAHGLDTVRDAVRRNIAQMRLLESLLGDAGFRILPDGELSIACARWEPADAPPESLDALQAGIATEVVARGTAWFSTTRHDGETWLRFNTVNLHTRDAHIRRLAAAVTDAAHRVERRRGD